MSRRCPKCGAKTVNNGVEGEGFRFICTSCDKVVDHSDTRKLNVSDPVIAEMLARVTAGRISAPGGSIMGAKAIAEYAKATVASLLKFRIK